MTRTAAIIGLNWGVRAHLSTFRRLGWQVEMLVGRDPERTSHAAALNGVPKWSCHPAEAFQRGFDLVAIAVPWPHHATILESGLEAGATLLVEHPLALTAEASRSVTTRAEQRGLAIFVNLPTRFMQPAMELRAHTRAHEAGRVGFVEHTFTFPSDEESEWVPLLLTHSLDLADSLFGLAALSSASLEDTMLRPASDCPSWAWPLRAPSMPDDRSITASAITTEFTVRDGGVYRLRVGYSSEPDFVERIVTYRDYCSVGYETRLTRENELSPWAATPLCFGLPGREPPIPSTKILAGVDMWLEAHVRQLQAIAAVLDGQLPTIPPATAADALRTQDRIEAALDSSR